MRRLDLDMLRILAITLVLGYHFAIPGFEYGFLGVDLFFVLSGYLIWGIISKQQMSPMIFLWRRIHRIYPAMVFVLSITVLISTFKTPELIRLNLEQAIWSILSLQNIYFFQRSGYFEPSADTFVFLHYWSLAVEVQFYLLCAISMMLIKKTKWLFVFFTVGSLISLFLCFYFGQIYKSANFYLLPTRLWEFYLGALAFQLKYCAKEHHDFRLIKFFAYLLCVTIPFSPKFLDIEYVQHPGLLTLILCISAATFSWDRDYLKRSSAISYYAKITYSVYLVHWPILHLTNLDNSFLSIGLSLVTGAILFLTIEKNNTIQRSICLCVMLVVIIIIAPTLSSFVAQKWYDPARYHFLKYDHKIEADRLSSNFNKASIKDSNNVEADILIIGDSYAMDLYNALQMAAPNMNVGTFHLSSSCGVLWDLEAYKSHWLSKDEKVCQHMGDLKNIDWHSRSDNAIFLASRWQQWQIPFLAGTLNQLPKDVQIFLFGSKSFSNQNFRKLAMGEIDNLPFEYPVELFQLNGDLQKIAERHANVSYIDTMQAFCDDQQCSNFDATINNIHSYDGFHFTDTGTHRFSKNLLSLLNWTKN